MIVDSLYEYAIKNLPRTTLLEAVNNIFEGKPFITGLDWKCHPYPFFYIKEEFDNTPSEADMREAHSIYISFRNYIFKNVSKEEREMLSVYTTFGDFAEFKYNIDERHISTFNNILKDNICVIDTNFGKLEFKFCTRDAYNVGQDTLAGYDTNTKQVIVFMNEVNNIKTGDLILLLRKRDLFIHELSHYIDDINKNLSYEEYGNSKEELIQYINDPSEFKANSQEIVYCFGGYLFKNQTELINKYNLTNKNDIKMLFDRFIFDYSNKNILQRDDLERFQSYLKYWKPENREKFYNFLYDTILDTQTKIDYTESEHKNNMLKLLTLEETFLKKE